MMQGSTCAQAAKAIAELFPVLPEPVTEEDMVAGTRVVAEHCGGNAWGRMQAGRCALLVVCLHLFI